jgi:hypothetical protein
MAQEKRVNYFQGMMLVDQDFRDDQSYHRQLRHNHNLELHTWGVVRGLEVSGDKAAVTVAEGLAIDANGKEIWWAGGAIQPSGSDADGSYLVIESFEVFSDDYPQMKGKFLRVTDTAKFSWKSAKADSDVVLALLSKGQPDPSVRRIASSYRANGGSIEIRPVAKEGSLRFLTGAPLTERLTIAPTGNIGIGTSDPGYSKLKIANSATDFVDVRFHQDGAGQLLIIGWNGGWNINAQTNEKHLYLNRDAGEKSNVLIGRSGKELFVSGKDGNVGIGTTTPGDGYKLDVGGKVKATGFDGSGSGLTGINPASITGKLTAGQIPDLKDIAGQLPATKISDQWTKRGSSIYYDIGNVGIGTTTPGDGYKLDVAGKVKAAGFDGPGGGLTGINPVSITGKLTAAQIPDLKDIAGQVPATKISDQWTKSGSNIYYGTGSVGIGTPSPSGQLEVGTSGSPTRIKFGGQGGDVHHLSSTRDWVLNSAAGNFVFRKLKNYTDLTEFTNLMTINDDGNVAVTGKISCGGYIALKTFHNTYVAADGDKKTMRQNATRVDHEQFTLEMACSREFKENISDISVEEAMTTLQALNPIRYDYKGVKAFRQNLGFIAEEMPDNLASEDRKSISPFEIIPVLTRVAKEQQKSIAALQETIRALQRKVQLELERNDDERANTTPA